MCALPPLASARCSAVGRDGPRVLRTRVCRALPQQHHHCCCCCTTAPDPDLVLSLTHTRLESTRHIHKLAGHRLAVRGPQSRHPSILSNLPIGQPANRTARRQVTSAASRSEPRLLRDLCACASKHCCLRSLVRLFTYLFTCSLAHLLIRSGQSVSHTPHTPCRARCCCSLLRMGTWRAIDRSIEAHGLTNKNAIKREKE